MANLKELLALQKLSTLRLLIKENGGLFNCAYKMCRWATDHLFQRGGQ